MNENPENSTPKSNGVVLSKPLIITVCVLFLVLILLIGVLIFLLLRDGSEAPPATEPSTTGQTTTAPAVEDTTVPEETQPKVMLPNMADLYAQNPDVAGYIRIEGTKLDYPVMYTPGNQDKYDRLNFEGKYSSTGMPYINENCTVDPQSDNLVIYGHHMKNGKGFTTITRYANESYYKEHPTVYYSTLYEDGEYEILAAFYDKVYHNYDDVFKYYRFFEYNTEEGFNEAVEYYKSKAEYDTGVEAVYGDKFLTLVTCSYHEKNGRFVVIVRIPGEEAPAEAE
jgi:sortase B